MRGPPAVGSLTLLHAHVFFYSGARALLVSHWAVDSNAAISLTTSTFNIIRIQRSAAPRRCAAPCSHTSPTPLIRATPIPHTGHRLRSLEKVQRVNRKHSLRCGATEWR